MYSVSTLELLRRTKAVFLKWFSKYTQTNMCGAQYSTDQFAHSCVAQNVPRKWRHSRACAKTRGGGRANSPKYTYIRNPQFPSVRACARGGAQELQIGGSPESGFLWIPTHVPKLNRKGGCLRTEPMPDLNLGRDAEVRCMRKVRNKCSAFRGEQGIARGKDVCRHMERNR